MTKKIVAIVAAVILVIGISAGTTLLVGKKDVPVATKVEDGLSAYELAVQFGYEGTVQEWLESLEGKSAYQIAVDSGYKGTESEWLASLKATSDNTANIKNAKFNSKGELILTLSDDTTINLGVAVGTNGKDGAAGKNGADGKDGQNGTPGKDGVDGKDGVSISEASINNEGQLILTFTDGKSFNLDKVVGAKGEAGIGIANSKINEQGELVITYSNGQETNLGKVLGADGKDGQDGAAGKDGNAIVSTVINNSGELVVTYSNGTSDNLGVVVGKDGQDGADGKDGINGSDGKDGKDGADGKDGVNGTNGKDGVDGEDGVGVSSAQINSYGELVITYTNGQISTLGKVIGADGKDGKDGADGKDGVNGTNGQDGKDGEDGISISKSEINSKGELVITYSNNEVENLGVVVGSKGADGKDGVNGADGKDGEDGKDGIGIEDIKIESGNLFITLSNGTTMNLGNIKGADGKDGVNGTNGKDGADGKDGQDGAPGADGIDGKDGISISGAEINAAKELVLTFSDGTDKNLGVVVGTDGADGKDGINGTNGADGKDGRGIKKTEINAIGELVITYTDDTSDNLGVIISDNGGAGTGAIAPRIQINASTNEWEISTDGGETYVSTGVKATGADGKDGADGADGKDGANGIGVTGANINDEKELVLKFSDGTEKNLGVIVGADGKDGADGEDGQDGINGTNGIDGKDGQDGADGKDGVGISGAAIESNNHLVLTLSNGDTIDVGVVVGADGKNGVAGEDGQDGVDGEDGKDGVGIKNVTVSEEGILTVTLDNDTIFTLGNIRGKDGIGIAKTEINAEGELVITYTDNQVVTLDKVVGADGVGIKSAEITEDYMLKLVFTDNGTQEVGPIRGEKGADGVGIKNVSVGDDGYLYITYSNSDEAQKIAYIKGDKGDPGADGKTPYIKNGTWWIGDSDTGIAATGEDGADGKAGVGVANSYVDENLHLWIVLSDGTKIDAGYVGVTTGGGTTTTKYTVVFKDYDGTVLKTEEVESGKSATAPANPTRNGFDFAGWDTDFSNITSSIVVTAKYTENTKPSIQVSNVTAKAGDTVQVPVIIKNNPGIAGATLTLNYNSGLTLTSADSGEAFSSLTCSKPGKFTSPCNFTWDSESGETKENGTILYLTFTVPSTASAGDVFEISCSYRNGDIFNDNMDDVTLTTISGGITVN